MTPDPIQFLNRPDLQWRQVKLSDPNDRTDKTLTSYEIKQFNMDVFLQSINKSKKKKKKF